MVDMALKDNVLYYVHKISSFIILHSFVSNWLHCDHNKFLWCCFFD